jgi:hypothetical protein
MLENAFKTIKHGIYGVFGDWSKTPNWLCTPQDNGTPKTASNDESDAHSETAFRRSGHAHLDDLGDPRW